MGSMRVTSMLYLAQRMQRKSTAEFLDKLKLKKSRAVGDLDDHLLDEYLEFCQHALLGQHDGKLR